MNEDQAKGRIKEAEGKLKEVTGRVVGNPRLEAEGKVENVAGKVQAGLGDLKAEVKKA